MAVVVLLVITFLAIRGISKPFFGLLGLLIVYVVQPGEIYPTLAPLHLERVLALFVLASFFFHGNKLKFPPVTRWFLAFYGAMLVSIPLAYWSGNSIQFCIQFGEIVVFHLLIVALLTTQERIRGFLLTFVALTGWLAGTSMFLYFSGVRIFTMGIDRAEGMTSSGGDPNSLGLTLVSAMPIEFLFMLKGNSKWTKLFAFSVFILSVVTIVSTGSRTSAFAFIFFLLLVVFADWKKRLKYIPILVVLAPLIWIVIPQQYKARYETVDNLKDDDSYQNRILSWKGGVQMFLSNPLTGVGPDNYTDANGEKYWPAKPRHWLNAHNLFFKLIGELGMVGVITFVGYLVVVFRTNAHILREWRSRAGDIVARKYPLYCNIALVILLFGGYSGHNLYRNTWYILGAITAAVGLLQPGEDKEKAEPIKSKRPAAAWLAGSFDEPELDAADSHATTSR
jgi:O-antigen ligase